MQGLANTKDPKIFKSALACVGDMSRASSE